MKSKKGKLEQILDFVKFTHKFQQVKRLILVTGETRDENDAEHSFQLALIAWFLIDSESLALDQAKVMKYALAHDLVEVYAGDTYFYSRDSELINSKAEREDLAAKRIKSEFSEFPELHQIIHDYEAKADPESKFVYALDKIIPAMNVYLDGGKSWQRDKVTYEMIRTKDLKVVVSPEAMKIWKNILKS